MSCSVKEGFLEEGRCQVRPRSPESPRCMFSCFIGKEIKLQFIITASSVERARISLYPTCSSYNIADDQPREAINHSGTTVWWASLPSPLLTKTARGQKGSSRFPPFWPLRPLRAPQLRPAGPELKETQQKRRRHFSRPLPRPQNLPLPGAGIAPTPCQGVAVPVP